MEIAGWSSLSESLNHKGEAKTITFSHTLTYLNLPPPTAAYHRLPPPTTAYSPLTPLPGTTWRSTRDTWNPENDSRPIAKWTWWVRVKACPCRRSTIDCAPRWTCNLGTRLKSHPRNHGHGDDVVTDSYVITGLSGLVAAWLKYEINSFLKLVRDVKSKLNWEFSRDSRGVGGVGVRTGVCAGVHG